VGSPSKCIFRIRFPRPRTVPHNSSMPCAQVCALFNGRTNKSSARFTCPSCYVQIPKTPESLEKASKLVKGSEDLARCTMSDAIEKGLSDALQAAYTARSNELGMAFEDVEKVDGLCVRVLSNVEKRHYVGEKVGINYTSVVLDCPLISHSPPLDLVRC
jgi:hypothetical protein